MLLKHYQLSGLPQFRQLSSEWSTGAGVFLCVSHCIKSGLARAQHPGEALLPFILDMFPCQTDTGGGRWGGLRGVLEGRGGWGGSQQSSAVCQGLRHMRVLASFTLFSFFCTVMAANTSHTHMDTVGEGM